MCDMVCVCTIVGYPSHMAPHILSDMTGAAANMIPHNNISPGALAAYPPRPPMVSEKCKDAINNSKREIHVFVLFYFSFNSSCVV